jgi:hypothetical protein
MAVGGDFLLEDTIIGDSFASSSGEILDVSSTTEVTFTLSTSTATTTSESTSTESVGTTTQAGIIDSLINVVQSLIQPTEPTTSVGDTNQTETVSSSTIQSETQPVQEAAPTPVEHIESPTQPSSPVETSPSESQPTSYLDMLYNFLSGQIITHVFAEEATSSNVMTEPVPISDLSENISQPTTEAPVVQTTASTSSVEDMVVPTEESSVLTEITTQAVDLSSTTQDMLLLATSSEVVTSSTEVATTTATTTEEGAGTLTHASALVEVLYTFDGVTWSSLGELDRESMKYRTFEIPLNATTTWNDMERLQVKVVPKRHIDSIPSMYLDGIKVEVLYETIVEHIHPDFERDTILEDVTVGDVRIVRLKNSDTDKEEVWYMYPEATSSSATTIETASGTVLVTGAASTTTPAEISSTTSVISEDIILATSTATSSVASTLIQKNSWYKLNRALPKDGSIEQILDLIKEEEKRKKLPLPDFKKDEIKSIKGTVGGIVVAHLSQDDIDTLWIFNLQDGTENKIDEEGIAPPAKDYPFAIKDRNIFWLSEDETMVFTYNIDSKTIDYRIIPPYDKGNGERGEVDFSNLVWKVYVGASNFSFYSEFTGEVFSDDNLTTVDVFRSKEELDTLVTKEKLEDLNFVIEDNNEQ